MKTSKNKKGDDSKNITIGGDVSNSTIIIGNDNAAWNMPKQSIDSSIKSAIKFIELSCYADAEKKCSDAIEIDSKHPEANLLWSIAVLADKGTDRLSDRIVSLVEKRLISAIEHPITMPTALALLGIVKYDYYVANGLYEGKPNFQQILERLTALDANLIRHDLIRHIKASKTALKRLGLA